MLQKTKGRLHQASLRLQPNDITQAIKYTNATPTNLITKGITKQTHKIPFALQRYAKHIKKRNILSCFSIKDGENGAYPFTLSGR